VIPFAAVMVPNDFNAMFFDQFVDLLNDFSLSSLRKICSVLTPSGWQFVNM
jgi:hypothetical protein